jgi:hypothetical protein
MACGEKDVKCFFSQLLRDFKTDAAIGAGDQGRFSRFHPRLL